MIEFKITFVGLCLFLGIANEPRTVIIPDVLSGDDVHGNHIESHVATLRVLDGKVSDANTNWPYTIENIDGKTYRFFPLRHQQLTISGIADTPFVADPAYLCLVPRLEEQCPAHEAVQPIESLKKNAVAWLQLQSGRLSAEVMQKGAVSSVYTVPAGHAVTITGTSAAATWTIAVEPDTEVVIANVPALGGELVPNHFLAYYKILMPTSCCTNIPFPYKHLGCPSTEPKPTDIAGLREPERVSTVACSNSNYP